MSFNHGRNEYEHINHLQEPYLIQRCTAGEFVLGMKTSDYLELDYMGSAEFEFGALPAWQRHMNSKLDRLHIRLVEHNGQTLYVMAEDAQLSRYADMIRDLIDGKIRTKELVGLDRREIGRKNGRPIYDDPSMPYKFDCWWDITNGLVFARSIEILQNLKLTIPVSVKYMDSKKENV